MCSRKIEIFSHFHSFYLRVYSERVCVHAHRIYIYQPNESNGKINMKIFMIKIILKGNVGFVGLSFFKKFN